MNKLLSPWIREDHCAMRVLDGTDPSDVANRVAFIEKSPRVRVNGGHDDVGYEWEYGPKGVGGSGDARMNMIYGFYPPSREWCDKRLRELGYQLPEDVNA